MNWNRFAARRVWGYYKKPMPRTEPILPAIEKGVPMPVAKLKDGRRMRRGPSKWREFLGRMEAGDSFVLEYPECSTVKACARVMGVVLVWERLPGRGPGGMAQERIWRVTAKD